MVAVEVPRTLEYRGVQLNSAPVLEDFQNSPNDEEDTRSSHEYLNDLKKNIKQELFWPSRKDSSKRVLKGSALQKQPTKLNATNVAKRDEEEVSPDDNERVEVKVLMALAEENDAVSKEGARNSEWVKNSMRKAKRPCLGKSSADDTKVSIPGVERLWLSEVEGFILPNHDTGRKLPAESQRNTTDPSVALTDSSISSFNNGQKFVNKPVVENSKAMSSEEEPKVVRKSDDTPIIEDWVSDNEEEDVSQPKIEKK
ncbi:hypothetical protein Tco_0425287 [Tanacetum coccineum]